MPTSRVLIFSSVGAPRRGAGCWSKATSRFRGITPTAFMVPLFIGSARLVPLPRGGMAPIRAASGCQGVKHTRTKDGGEGGFWGWEHPPLLKPDWPQKGTKGAKPLNFCAFCASLLLYV